jgi:hypothetical protein
MKASTRLGAIHLSGEVALEAADDLELGVAFGGLLGDVVLGSLIDSKAGDHGQVEGGVGLPVTASVESVSSGQAGGGG